MYMANAKILCWGRHLYSTDWRRGLASGVTQILHFALGVTQILHFALAPRYQHVGISNAKFWRRGYCPTPTPDARYFASQWNIGLTYWYLKGLADPTQPSVYPTRPRVYPTQASGKYFALGSFTLASQWSCRFHVVCFLHPRIG